jgi:hypothetical protein
MDQPPEDRLTTNLRQAFRRAQRQRLQTGSCPSRQNDGCSYLVIDGRISLVNFYYAPDTLTDAIVRA